MSNWEFFVWNWEKHSFWHWLKSGDREPCSTKTYDIYDQYISFGSGLFGDSKQKIVMVSLNEWYCTCNVVSLCIVPDKMNLFYIAVFYLPKNYAVSAQIVPNGTSLEYQQYMFSQKQEHY